jgi:GntR family transcriptional regulator/MocR family aminotransferase
MDLHVALDPRRPKRDQLEHHLRDAIRAGRLHPGTRLPPSRVLASDLGVSRGLVVEVYGQLAAEGFLTTRRGSGTRVAAHDHGGPHAPRGSELPRTRRYDLRSGIPDPAAFPRRQWRVAAEQALRDLPDAAFVTPTPGGLPALRVALATHLGRSRAVHLDASRLLITSGVGPGLELLLHVLADRGARRVGVEDPSWPVHARAVERAGMQAVPVPVDADGIVVGLLPGLHLDGVVITPAHQFPTGVVLSADRRPVLVDWARRTGATVIEDDYDAEYRYDRDPVASLQGLAPDVVAYAGSASKTLAPTLRMGWLGVPQDMVDQVLSHHRAFDAWPSVIDQATLATLVDHGDLDRHLRRMRRSYRARRDALVDALAHRLGIAATGVAAGLHLVAPLGEEVDEAAVVREARAAGVAVHGLSHLCWTSRPVPPALLLGYAGLTEPAIGAAVEALAGVPSLAPLAARVRADT